LQALCRGKMAALFNFSGQVLRHVSIGPDFLAGRFVVRHLHDVIHVTLLLVAAGVQDLHQPRMRARDGHELLDAPELALERIITLEVLAFDNLDRMKSSDDVASQPDFSVSAFADATNELMIGNDGLALGRRAGNDGY